MVACQERAGKALFKTKQQNKTKRKKKKKKTKQSNNIALSAVDIYSRYYTRLFGTGKNIKTFIYTKQSKFSLIFM